MQNERMVFIPGINNFETLRIEEGILVLFLLGTCGLLSHFRDKSVAGLKRNYGLGAAELSVSIYDIGIVKLFAPSFTTFLWTK